MDRPSSIFYQAHHGGRRYDPNSYEFAHFQSIDSASIKSGWKKVENWQGTGKGRVRKHDKGLDYLEATEPGAELTVEFSGTAIGLPMVAGPDVGIIEWRVDGVRGNLSINSPSGAAVFIFLGFICLEKNLVLVGTNPHLAYNQSEE